MRTKPSRAIASTVLALVCIWNADAASIDTYPTRPIRVVTAPAGAGNDFMARVISQGLSGSLGQQLVVDNRPAGIIGEIVAKAPPDGYTLLAIGSVLWLTPFLQDTVGYDPVKDFAPVSITARSVNILVVHPSIAATSVKELLALARAKPGQLNCASGATGSSNHLAAELFRSMGGVDFVRIPYKGSGPALNDLLSGQMQMMFPTSAAGLPHVKSGRLRALAVTSLQPSSLAPGLPTVAESGVPGYESVVMYALLAPAKTPANIVNKLQTELARSLKSPATAEKLAAAGVEPVASSPRELAAAMDHEMTRLGKIIKEARLRSN
jgi:tripartite-type tricarboxylate transporter receptor subunit TctC